MVSAIEIKKRVLGIRCWCKKIADAIVCITGDGWTWMIKFIQIAKAFSLHYLASEKRAGYTTYIVPNKTSLNKENRYEHSGRADLKEVKNAK